MNTTTEPNNKKQITFNSNPFSLAFSAMSQAFKINQNPTIAIIVGGIVIGVANQISGYVPDFIDMFVSDDDKVGQAALGLFSILFAFGIMIVSIFISTLWTGFTAHVGLNNAKGLTTTVKSSLKAGLSKFWSIFLINLVVALVGLAFLTPSFVIGIVAAVLNEMDQKSASLGMLIASIILFIAGLVFAIRYSLARSLSVYAELDEGAGALGSLRRSASLTKNRVIEAWGMAFPGAIVPIVGGVLGACGMGSHYLQLKTYKDHHVELPKVHIVSWIPLMLVAALFLIGAFIAIVIFALAINS